MFNRIKRVGLAGLMALTMAFSTTSLAAEGALQRVNDFKVLKVGMSGDQPPMNTVNRSGQLMGFDVDLARALAAAMQVQLEIKTMPFGDLMEALEQDKVDMVISGMAITPARTEKASFVGPYMLSGKSLLTKDTALARISESEQINKGDIRLVALKNSTSASFVRDAAPNARLIEVSNYDEGVQMVINDKADGMIADMPACVLAVLRYPDSGLGTLNEPLNIEPIGIAIARDDAQFLNLVDNFVDSYEKAGLLKALRKKWFEDKSWIAALP
jgi:ABC-type amino acid transport substrate-binding protein